MIASAAVLAPVLWWALQSRKIKVAQLPMLLGLGMVGFALNRVLNYWGVHWSTAVNATLLMAMEPLLTLLLAWWFLREAFTRRKVGGLLLGVTGAYFVIARGFQWPDFSTAGVVGDVLFLLGLVLEATYSIWGKTAVRKLSPVMVTAGAVVLAAGFWIPTVTIDGLLNGWPVVSGNFLLAVLYLSVGCTVFNYMVWLYILSHMEAGPAGMSLLLQPLVGTALAAIVLGETMTEATWIGGGLVVLSLVLSLSGGHSPPVSGTKETRR